MPLKFKQFFGVLALLATAVGTAHAQSKELSSSGVLLDRVAAVVNDGIVLRSDVERQMQVISDRIQQQGQQLPPRNVLRQQVLERLVLQELQMQRADRLGIKIPDEAVNQALTEVAQRNKIKFSDLPAALEAQGVDYRDYRDEVRREMTMQTLRQRDVLARVYVSPREVDQCIAKRKASPNADNEYNLAHILVAIPSTADEKQIAERTSRAQAVYERAKKNEDFAQLAITYSDSGTALEGGALGWRKSSQLPSFVADIIPNLEAGDVTEPIRTPSGLHIFKVLEVRGGQAPAIVSQVHARHILMKPNEVEDDQTVRQKLAQIRERVLKGESFEAIASVTSEDPGSAAQGGDLGWAGPGSFVPEFERQLDALEDNQISEPFKTQFGWHIVQLLGRRTYDASEDVTRNRCVSQMREARADEETEIWLRRLRDEAFVDYRM
jgi:peptidyl-prolyl cis-trans isomerase SurA